MNGQNATDKNNSIGRPGTSRRALLTAGAGAALTTATVVGAGASPADASPPTTGERRIPVAPGVEVNVSDLNGGRRGTVVFVPGWPLASTTFEYNTPQYWWLN